MEADDDMDVVEAPPSGVTAACSQALEIFRAKKIPRILVEAGKDALRAFVEFFAVTIRNENNRAAYVRAVKGFLQWCKSKNLFLAGIEPVHVAAWIESHRGSAPSVKQQLAAVRMLFDWLVVKQIVRSNPATYVRGPTLLVKQKTPVLTAEDARALLEGVCRLAFCPVKTIAFSDRKIREIPALHGKFGDQYFAAGTLFWNLQTSSYEELDVIINYDIKYWMGQNNQDDQE